MSKTPEQMAEDKAYELGSNNVEFEVAKDAFLAGYQAAQQWISVKERLPENSVGWTTVYGCILSRWAVQPGFYTKDSGVWVSRFVDQHEDCHNYLPFESVTHWMPLPAAPKEEA
jgi:hypothetical protein